MILIKNSVKNWKEALKLGVSLLVDEGFCSNELEQKILDNYEKNGPYFVIAPRIALAHAEPGDYIYKNGISLILLKKETSLSNQKKHDVNLFFTLSATGGEEHMKLISKFARIFSSDLNLVQKLILATSADEVKEILKDLFS